MKQIILNILILNAFALAQTTVTDIDGNTYPTITIGDQVWMAENLKVTHYQNGDPITKVLNASTWLGLNAGAYCNYNNDDSNANLHGSLYNWYAAVDSRNIAPEGWHVPSDEELNQLEMFIGMSQAEAEGTGFRGTDEGTKLKSTSGWNASGNGTDEYGFTALPSGFRSTYTGYDEWLGSQIFLWTASENSGSNAWYHSLPHDHTDINRGSDNKKFGFSIRCVKDVIETSLINIPADHSTIQAGIDAAVDGDTLLVQPGVYVETIDYIGKDIVIGSLFLTTQDTSYISQTIIDGNYAGTVVTFINDESENAELVGLTVQKGSATYGGGILLDSASPTLHNLIIRNNTGYDGAGISMIYYSYPEIFNVEFYGNTASSKGGALACHTASNPILSNLLIHNNTADYAAGIYSSGESFTLRNSTITDNTANHGGSITAQGPTSATITNSILRNGPVEELYFLGYSGLILAFTNIEGGQSSFSGNATATISWGDGIIDDDPRFTNSSDFNYKLSDYSSSIGAGTPTGVPIADFDDSPRPNPAGSNPDIGAYENALAGPIHNSSIHVSTSGEDNGSVGVESAPFASVQAAIDYSENGDTVLVQPGTYMENINFNGKNIVVGSLFLTTQDTSFISQTVIDGNQSGSVVTFESGEDTTAYLCGLTITNGVGVTPIGGIDGDNSGGGVFIYTSSPKINNCTISVNFGNVGSAMFIKGSAAIIEHCEISNNVGSDEVNSTTVFLRDSSPRLTNSKITNNTGMGVYSYGCSGTYLYNLFDGNSYIPMWYNIGDVVQHCTFTGNGGPLTIWNGKLENCLVADNLDAGLQTWWGSTVELVNVTIANNQTSGIAYFGNNLTLTNCIVSGNAESIYNHFSDTVYTYYSNINYPEAMGTGSIARDPKFVDGNNNNYSLMASSFCINSGHPDSTDSDGTRADMGAYPYLNSYNGTDWHVAIDGDDVLGTGELSNPFASIQAGINFSEDSDSIKVSSGTYYEHVDLREKSIILLGLSGSVFTTIDGSNSGRPITMHNQTQTSQSLSGFTLQNGSEYTGAGIYVIRSNALLNDLQLVSNTSSYQGGGIYSESSDLNVSNVLLAGNSANNGGAGLLIYESSLVGENIVAYENTSTENGGFIHLYTSSASFNHATIVDNAAANGPVVYSRINSTVEIINSILWNNSDNLFFQDADSTIAISYSNVEGGFEGSENFNINPWFTDPESHIYNLSENSRCLGAGYDTTFITSTDIDGNPRPNPAGSNPDVGAYENPLAEPLVIVEVQNLSIGGTEEMLHLTSHSPLITYSYYNSLEDPLGFHQIQVSSLSDFSLIDKWDTYTVINPDTTVTYAGNTLVDGETYYLRVKAGSGDIWTDWETLSFRMNSFPQAPNLVSPTANTVIDEDLLFTVENSSDLEEDDLLYQFSLFEDVAMTVRVDSSELLVEGVEQTMWLSDAELLDNNQYWWTSRVFDGYEYSSLSVPASFLVNTENAAPETFELLFPTPEIVISSLTPTFSWHSSLDVDPDDEVSYSLHLDTPEPGVLIFELGSDTLFFPPEALVDNTVYYWRVVAKDLLGFETESLGGYRSFVVNVSNDNPSIVDLITPDSVMVLSLAPEMFWTRATDVDPGDMVTYEMHWWGNGIEFDSVLTDTNAVVIPRELQDNMQYFWEVIAMDQVDGISHSEPATFWTDLIPEAPEGFALLSPENDAGGLSNMPSFQWEIAEDPDPFDYATYTLQIASDSSFTEVVFETNTTIDVGHELTEALPTDTEYWWRVIATDTDSLTTESETFVFTVGYVSIAEDIALPTEYMLDQNYPNPFNPSTTIRYGLPEETNVSLVIYDVRGQVVQMLESEHQSAGWYDVVWDGQTASGKTISTGIYFARLVAGDYSQVVKMLYLK